MPRFSTVEAWMEPATPWSICGTNKDILADPASALLLLRAPSELSSWFGIRHLLLSSWFGRSNGERDLARHLFVVVAKIAVSFVSDFENVKFFENKLRTADVFEAPTMADDGYSASELR